MARTGNLNGLGTPAEEVCEGPGNCLMIIEESDRLIGRLRIG